MEAEVQKRESLRQSKYLALTVSSMDFIDELLDTKILMQIASIEEIGIFSRMKIKRSCLLTSRNDCLLKSSIIRI
jgi:hypothetical protein